MFVIILKVFYDLFLIILFFLDLLTLALGTLLMNFLILNWELIYYRKLFVAFLGRGFRFVFAENCREFLDHSEYNFGP